MHHHRATTGVLDDVLDFLHHIGRAGGFAGRITHLAGVAAGGAIIGVLAEIDVASAGKACLAQLFALGFGQAGACLVTTLEARAVQDARQDRPEAGQPFGRRFTAPGKSRRAGAAVAGGEILGLGQLCADQRQKAHQHCLICVGPHGSSPAKGWAFSRLPEATARSVPQGLPRPRVQSRTAKAAPAPGHRQTGPRRLSAPD